MKKINYHMAYIVVNNFFRSKRIKYTERTPNLWRFKDTPSKMLELKRMCRCTYCSKCSFTTTNPKLNGLCSVRFMFDPLRKTW